jgi:HEAT repeat protein
MANIPPMMMTRLVGQLTGAMRNLRIYPATHSTSQKLFEASLKLIKEAMGTDNLLSFSLAGNILLMNDKPVPDSRKEVFANFIAELGKRSVGQLTFKQGVDLDQMQGFFETMAMDVEQVKAKGGLAMLLSLRGISNIVASGISYGGGSGGGSAGGGSGLEGMLPDQVVAMLKNDPRMVSEMLLKGALAMSDTPEGQEKLGKDLDQLAQMAKAQGGGDFAALMANMIGGMDQKSNQMVAQAKLDNPEWSDVVRELLVKYSDEDLGKLIINKAGVLARETKNDSVMLSERLRAMIASIPADAARKKTLLPLVQPNLLQLGLSLEDCAFVFGQNVAPEPVREKYLADLVSRPASEMTGELSVKTLRWIIRRDDNCKPAMEGFLKLLADGDPRIRAAVLSYILQIKDDLLSVERFDLIELVINQICFRLRQESDQKLYQAITDLVLKMAEDLKNKQRQALVAIISKELSDIMLLSLIGDDSSIRSLIQGLLKEPILEPAAEALVQIKDKTVPYLLEAVKESEDSNMRLKCMYVLNRIGAGVEEMAIKALPDDRWFVRRNMCILICLLGTEKSIKPLVEALEDKDARVRLEALKALFKIAGQNSEAWMIRALKDKDDEVKKQAIEYAGKSGTLASADALAELYFKKDLLGRGEPVEIKRRIITAAGLISNKSAASLLMNVARDKDPELSKEAETVLIVVLKKLKEQIK